MSELVRECQGISHPHYQVDRIPSYQYESTTRDQRPHSFTDSVAVYTTPPSSPLAQDLSNFVRQFDHSGLVQRGMDNDDRYRQQYRTSGYQSSEGIGGNPSYSSSSPATDQSRPFMPPTSRRDVTVTEGAHNPSAPAYGGYPYGDPQGFMGSTVQPSAVPGANLQFQEEYPGAPARHQQGQPTQQQQYPSYQTGMVYGIGQQAAPQSQYQQASQYQARQPANVDMQSQYGTSQYYGTGASATAGIPAGSQYIAPQVEDTHFSQQGAGDRIAVPQSYSATMAEYDHRAMSHARQQVPTGEPDTTDVAYERFQIRVRLAFEHIRAGRVLEASQELLTISEWLLRQDVLQGMVDLSYLFVGRGFLIDTALILDDSEYYEHRIRFWEEFNLGWLACAQKQKELTLERGPLSPGLLSLGAIRTMGNTLTQLCERLEPHGLVDYQMGVWEEEIIAGSMIYRSLRQK